MRRTAIVALAGIALIFGASLLLVDRLTSADMPPGPVEVQAPGETENRVTPAPAPLASSAISPPDGAAPAPAPSPGPVVLSPVVSSRLAASASHVDLEGRIEALRARVTSRCGSMAIRQAEDPADPARGLDGEAVVLLDLHVVDGQARVTGSKILSQGTMRPALTACAQYALRNQVLQTFGGPETTLTIPLVVSMAGGSR